jgi:Sporulation and spore germination
MIRRPTRRHAAGLSAIAILLGACSLPADEGVTPIDADGLPPEIADATTTTTTSTTTTVPTTLPPPTSVPPATSAPTSPPPTTAPPRNATVVDIYYADRATDGMQPVKRLLLEPLTMDSVIGQLERPPDDLASYNVRTALEPGLIGPASLDRSVLTLSLNSPVLETMSDDQIRLAIAQMVLTFTSFAVPGEGNIGSVIIQVDGTPISVFLPRFGTTSDPGTQVVYDDFSTLVVGTTGATTTTAPPASTTPPTQTSTPPTGPSQ